MEHEHHHDHHCSCGCGHGHHCGCGHDHHHGDGHSEKSGLPVLLIGAGLFAAGLLLGQLAAPWHISLFVAAYLLLGWRVLVSAVKNLLKGHMLDENFLMGIATVGAFAIGEFSEAVGIMLFYRVGEFFESRAVERSRRQIMEAVDLRPEVVRLADGRIIPAEEAKVGDILIIRPGDRIPLDAAVLSGVSRIDTAPITGEPMPAAVGPGSGVISGCVNTTGQLTVQVEKTLKESMVTRILESVENAVASKPRFERFITRFARVYTPIVVGLAAAVAVVPSLITGDWSYWVYTALSFLVMSCPCALVLSVPLAFFSGIGLGGSRGILFKGGVAIEALAGIKAVVMDKTGTLTQGNFAVQRIEGSETLRLCAACEAHSSHPIAQSILSAAGAMALPKAEDVEELPGCGIRGRVEEKEILCGNEKLMAKFGIACEGADIPQGTRVWVAKNGEIAGFLDISDTLKPGAAEAVERLKNRGITVAMLTGDGPEAAAAVAKAVGIEKVWARLLPEDKLTGLRKLRDQVGPTMFVGDGINDAPVLAAADVGAAMGSGADAAIEAADVVFLTSQVSAIADAIAIAARTRRIARQNVIFALAVKLAVVLLGLIGCASMWAAVFADSGVAMLCVLNSVGMLYGKKSLKET